MRKEMLCNTCGLEFDRELFSRCPFCLTDYSAALKEECSVDLEIEEPISESQAEKVESLNEETSNNVEENCRNNNELLLDIILDEFQRLSNRTLNLLHRNHIMTLRDLQKFVTTDNLSRIPGCGSNSISEVMTLIYDYQEGNLCLKNKRQITVDTSSPTFDVMLDDFHMLCDRSLNALHRNHIMNLRDLLSAYIEGPISKLRFCGKGVESEVEAMLKDLSNSIPELSHIYESDDETNSCLSSHKLNEDQTGNIQAGPGALSNINPEGKFSTSLEAINPFSLIDISLENMSIYFLCEEGVSKKIVDRLEEAGYKSLKELKELSPQEYIEIRHTLDRKSELSKVASLLENKTLLDCLSDVLNEYSKNKEGQILSLRAQGYTLQEISDMPQYNVTRERIRQIEGRIISRLLKYVECLFANYRIMPYGVVKYENISSAFSNNVYNVALFYTAKKLKSYKYLSYADVFVLTDTWFDFEDKLYNMVSSFVGEQIDINSHLEELDTALEINGFSFWDFKDVIRIMEGMGYRNYNGYVVKGHKSYAFLCLPIIAKLFPDGIRLTEYAESKTPDIKELRKAYRETYGNYPDIALPDNDRSLSTRLISTGLILRDRGKYILPDNVHIDEDALLQIPILVEKMPTNKVYFLELFTENKGFFTNRCGIDNYSFLHGVISAFFPDRYQYGRDYLIKNTYAFGADERPEDRIIDLIHRLNRPVSKSEVKQSFKGITDIMIAMAVEYNANLIQWDFGFFYAMDMISIGENDRSKLKQIILDVMHRNKGYASQGLVFNEAQRQMNAFLTQNKIKNEANLFYICMDLFAHEYDFRRPHILKPGILDSLSIFDIAMYLLDYPNEISYTQYVKLSETLLWSRSTVGIVFGDIEQNYTRVDEDLYIKNDLFYVSAEEIEKIEKSLQHMLNNGFLSLRTVFDFDEFPTLKYEWNCFLLESLISKYSKNYVVISPKVSDRRYQKGIVIKATLGITSFPEIVVHLMKTLGVAALNESQMYTLLASNGLAMYRIPIELYESDIIEYKDEQFKII